MSKQLLSDYICHLPWRSRIWTLKPGTEIVKDDVVYTVKSVQKLPIPGLEPTVDIQIKEGKCKQTMYKSL